MSCLHTYLADPLLHAMWSDIRAAGAIRGISVDLTHVCNLRCQGCYYFGEGMDQGMSDADETTLDQFIKSEKARGTNFVTIVGGEPALQPDRIRKIYQHFYTNVATNGLIKIPMAGLEELPIGIAVWGSHQTDSMLRANGKRDLFSKALDNYHDDPRVFWYYTVSPQYAHEIPEVVATCVEHGHPVMFNYYSDIAASEGRDHHQFCEVEMIINEMITCYPDRILTTPYFNHVITTGVMKGDHWGYEVCTNLSTDLPQNQARFSNGKVYNGHFRAYHADLVHTRRCCTGIHRSCDTCFDTWEHFSWVMLNLRKHLHSLDDFKQWLEVMYLFYVVNRIVDPQVGMERWLACREMQVTL